VRSPTRRRATAGRRSQSRAVRCKQLQSAANRDPSARWSTRRPAASSTSSATSSARRAGKGQAGSTSRGTPSSRSPRPASPASAPTRPPRREHAQPAARAILDCGAPQGRLADPGLAFAGRSRTGRPGRSGRGSPTAR
jgi:hypothetical protein